MRLNRFSKFAWMVLSYNILVVLWGAYVRATGSGAGCGSHWPLCNGEVIPRAPQVETIIELTHRLTSGIAFLLVVGMLLLAFRKYPKAKPRQNTVQPGVGTRARCNRRREPERSSALGEPDRQQPHQRHYGECPEKPRGDRPQPHPQPAGGAAVRNGRHGHRRLRTLSLSLC